MANPGWGFLVAAFGMFLGLFLAGSGEGWVTPLRVSFGLPILIPATLWFAWPGGRHPYCLLLLAAAALAFDAWLIIGTMQESREVAHYVEINALVGLLIMGTWLAVWFSWQLLLLYALLRPRHKW